VKKWKDLILTAGPSITEKEIKYVTDAVTNGWNNHWNDYIVKFENEFAQYIGVKHAMTTSSCTGALHLALTALGLKSNDEVIVPEVTWVATSATVTYTGAIPIFADIDYDTWCIDPELIKKNITSKTKAIMPVHNYGNVADMDAIMKIAKEYNLFVIEDAAPSLGATYKGKKTGSFGNVGAFSFQGAKIMTSGEGGMLVTDDTELFERVKKLNDHGRSLTKALWNDEIGYKYKMSNIQAALGLAQLERIEELVDKKREIFSWYYDNLKDIEGIKLNIEKKHTKSIYWMTSIILDKDFEISREEFINKLKEWNIDSRPMFYPMSSFPMFKTQGENKIAKKIGDFGINLPSGYARTQEEVHYICDIIKHILGVA